MTTTLRARLLRPGGRNSFAALTELSGGGGWGAGTCGHKQHDWVRSWLTPAVRGSWLCLNNARCASALNTSLAGTRRPLTDPDVPWQLGSHLRRSRLCITPYRWWHRRRGVALPVGRVLGWRVVGMLLLLVVIVLRVVVHRLRWWQRLWLLEVIARGRV